MTLLASIEQIGLQTPITVWAKPDDAFQLVAGAHRLAAAKHLGWETVDAFFMKGDDIDRQIWEIDENLMRSELTPTQFSEHLAKRKELWEAVNRDKLPRLKVKEIMGAVIGRPSLPQRRPTLPG